ncbi:MAG: glycine--tRNA ligase subunit beta [Proteobacteria bacterium]|nr:glycine--tRNA ligase subunit beta [Pseudomonadota bacterium]
MPELLIELLSEEIPARMQAQAAEDLKRLVTEGLKEAGLAFTDARAYVTPCRLALVVEGLPERQADHELVEPGPRVGAPEQAIQGFLRKHGLRSVEDAKIRDTGKGERYFAVNLVAGLPARRAVVDVLHNAIPALPWRKSMRWADTTFAWVRPLHNILAILDGQALDFDFDLIRTKEAVLGEGPRRRLRARNATVGHRFLAPGEITVTGFADYQKKLRDAYVILDAAERRKKIIERAGALAAAEGLRLRPDAALLDEVVGLVEWPVPLIAKIDPAFMDLPPEVLTAGMRAHQRYFALVDKDGRLAPRFIVVANIEAPDGGGAIAAGNERVLRARLADARFFWNHDRRRTLESRVPKLGEVVFHARLGTLADKVMRMQALIPVLAPFIPSLDVAAGERAALLAKADLTTDMVGEFPELQGVMGRYYALAEGAEAPVAEAIAEHYAPLGPSDACPSAPVSVAVALADKIDTLVGFWAIGEKPTGSKDPFALRRAALGVIRLIVENGLRVPLLKVFEAARLGGPAALQRGKPERTGDDLLAFFADRLKVALREKGVRHDLIAAVFALGGEDDLVRLLARVEALGRFLASDDGASLLVAYRRAANILRIEEKRDSRSYDGAVDSRRLVEAEERALDKRLAEVAGPIDAALAAERFEDAMAGLARLRPVVDAFFDRVTVNCEEKDLRENRLFLLARIRSAMERLADFSKIEG